MDGLRLRQGLGHLTHRGGLSPLRQPHPSPSCDRTPWRCGAGFYQRRWEVSAGSELKLRWGRRTPKHLTEFQSGPLWTCGQKRGSAVFWLYAPLKCFSWTRTKNRTLFYTLKSTPWGFFLNNLHSVACNGEWTNDEAQRPRLLHGGILSLAPPGSFKSWLSIRGERS